MFAHLSALSIDLAILRLGLPLGQRPPEIGVARPARCPFSLWLSLCAEIDLAILRRGLRLGQRPPEIGVARPTRCPFSLWQPLRRRVFRYMLEDRLPGRLFALVAHRRRLLVT